MFKHSPFVAAAVFAFALAATPTSAQPARDTSSAEPGRSAEQKPAAKPGKASAKSSKPDVKADEKAEKKGGMSADTWAGLKLRGIGPAVTSGRVVDIAVDPNNKSRWYVAVASGGVWKTVNNGTSFEPIFDGEASFSIGCVAIDPSNPHTIWVGSGENNSQRSVAYGDGVYKSEDGGKSWKNVGLKASEHIGKIVIHPKAGNIVYVAAQGPLWNAGGERGLYKTTDGGKSWKAVLTISEDTGVSDVAMDPRDPDTLYATAYQRRRHVWTLIDGGPEGAIHKTTDGGATWTKLTSGLPKEDIGRIGLAISPANPDVVYATVEAANKKGGFFRSADRGATWEKRNDYIAAPMYYGEIFADPKNVDRVYAVDVFNQVTNDGGKTWARLGEKWKHVDNHSIWIDPDDTNHLLVGSDGGVYESFDHAVTWHFKANLPVTQFYRVEVDNASPVYNVYGGTQDNTTLGGPSRSLTIHGVENSDWFVVVGGDGFHARVDPKDPNIVYGEYQHAGLVRFDRKSGEATFIQPQPGPGDDPLRWNWDSPLVLSPHRNTRLYFAAQRVFKSEDRGDTWKPISGDLTRRIDRNLLKVMGKVQLADAVAKDVSTSIYGNIVSLAESPLREGLLYVGTDDGLIQVSEDGGAAWRKVERFPGVPEMTYVIEIEPSQHDPNVVYAAFDNHKNGDFKPYLLKSNDRGATWTSIASNLPARGSVYTLAEDHVDRNLLFAGTEFALYFSKDGGKSWIQLKGGLPTILVKDLAIQKRENDLVLATFGRGFYILDDYAPLRTATEAALAAEAHLFPVKKPLLYIPSSPYDLRGKGFLGESHYFAPDPPFGAVFTYHLKDELKTRRERRHDAEREAEKKGETLPYPSLDALRAESLEEEPAVVLTVTDSAGNVVRRINGEKKAGVHRIAWDLRHPPANPTSLEAPKDDNPFQSPPTGPLVVPGRYTVSLAKRVEGKLTTLGEPQSFDVEALNLATLPAADKQALLAFQQKTARLQRAVLGASRLVDEVATRLKHLKQSAVDTPAADDKLSDELRALEARNEAIRLALTGDREADRRNQATLPSIVDRVQTIVGTQWTSSSAPTQTSLDAYQIAGDLFTVELEKLRTLVEVDLARIEKSLEASGAPWTPGRVPLWRKE